MTRANQDGETDFSSKPLLFQPGEEYKIKVEKLEEFEKSLFKDIYERAAGHVLSILEKSSSKIVDNLIARNDSYNNIICFTGERGTGKTSAMVSFAGALKSFHNYQGPNIFKGETDSLLKQKHFYDVGVIDPSKFEKNNNILEVIIADMFRQFDDKLKQEGNLNFESKRDLLKAFQQVYEDLKSIRDEKESRFKGEVIEVLSKLASGSDLGSSLKHLIDKFLEFMGIKKGNCHFLLVIDDFDLNIRNAGLMVEQIRKYLVQPGIVILMAAKLDQLANIVEQNYRKEFSLMLDKAVKRMSFNDPWDMATRYLEKLIPENRRLYLPGVPELRKKDIYVLISPQNIKKEPEVKSGLLEDIVLGLIYEKTGLIFLSPLHETHMLIPGNLRDLNALYVMLDEMEPLPPEAYDAGDEGKTVLRKNLKRFEDYFFNTWIKNNISLEEQTLLTDFLQVDLQKMNKFLILKIARLLNFDPSYKNMGMYSEDKDIDLFRTILNPGNNPMNISLGDVLFFLNKILSYDESVRTKRFVFAVKTIYSLLLTNLLFIREGGVTEAQSLLGGSVYNIERKKMIRGKGREDIDRRDFYLLNTNEFKNKVKIPYSEIKDSNILPFEKLQYIEWIHYFLGYLGQRNPLYRREEPPYYDRSTNLGGGFIEISYAFFDILAFVFYTLNPERTLERIFAEQQSFYVNHIKNESQSLYNQVLEWKNKAPAALPIYSVELMEQIFSRDLTVIKVKVGKETEYDFYEIFFSKLEDSLDELSKKIPYLSQSKLKYFFEECPVVKWFRNNRTILDEIFFKEVVLESEEKVDISRFFEFLDNLVQDLSQYYESNKDSLKQTGLKIKMTNLHDALSTIEQKGYGTPPCWFTDLTVEIKKLREKMDAPGSSSRDIYLSALELLKRTIREREIQ
jgi:hypothetical protein